MDVGMILMMLFAVLVFPGLLFVFLIAILSEWWLRKVVARAQKRMGPSYVGPAGILQPLADFLKLLFVKEEIKQKYSTTGLAKVFAFIGIGAMVAITLLLPLSPVKLEAPYDIVVLTYFCCVWAPFTMVVMALSIPNPFNAGGASRLLSIYSVTEPAYFMALIVPVFLVNEFVGSEVPYSVLETSQNVWILWTKPATAAILALSLLAILVTSQAKAMAQPFNIPEAEQELIAGPITEFSGPLLALSNFIHDAEIAITTLITVYLFLGGPYPFPHLSIPGAALVIIKYVALLTIIAVIKASFGRFRIEQGISVIVKYSLLPALLSIIIAMALNMI